jgi:hypothetical protein
MINFRLSEDVIHLYKENKETINCDKVKPELILDFIDEINGKKTVMDAKDILESQRQVLLIQKAAE